MPYEHPRWNQLWKLLTRLLTHINTLFIRLINPLLYRFYYLKVSTQNLYPNLYPKFLYLLINFPPPYTEIINRVITRSIACYSKIMDSIRERKRKPHTKSQLLTLGGVSVYNIEPAEITRLAKLISKTPNAQLPKLLEALLTKRELVDIIRRILIAEMLLQNKTYDKIQQVIKTSPSTIALVQQSLDKHNGILADAVDQQPKRFFINNIQPDPTQEYFRNRIRKGK